MRKKLGIHESYMGAKMHCTYKIPELPPKEGLETVSVLKALVAARANLAELNGRAASMPNMGILIDTLALQEAKASSEIENIVTTQDQVFQIEPSGKFFESPEQKELARYRDALKCGHDGLLERQGLLTEQTIIAMFRILKNSNAGYRSTPGTALRNDRTGEVVYVPPQHPDEISGHMRSLEAFLNGPDSLNLDPLIRMALVHHQFESIHPFSDGNGRIGRILNVLMLVQAELLDAPILYLSRYITRNKDDYYTLLQQTRDTGDWEPWLLFILNAVAETSRETTYLVEQVKKLMADYKHRIRDSCKFYSQDLLNNMFRHPYTRIEYVMDELSVSRPTATRYLGELADQGYLMRLQAPRRRIYFVNVPLVALFADVSQ